MTEDSLSPEAMDATERALAAVTREGERVGVDWDVVAGALLAEHPELAPDAQGDGDGSTESTADDTPILGIDVDVLLPILRELPDGAGTDAFLDALERSGPDASPPSDA